MYTESFIEKVKSLYPKDKRIHELADTGNRFLGRYLGDASGNVISVSIVIKVTDLNELKQLARLAKDKTDLYILWCQEDERMRNEKAPPEKEEAK